MSVGQDLGNQLQDDYIQIGTVRMPLPRNTSGRADEWDNMRTSPLEPFSATGVFGDDSLLTSDRIAQAVWSNFSPGLGIKKYMEQQSLDGYADGDLETNEPGALYAGQQETVFSTAINTFPYTQWSRFCTLTGFGFGWDKRYTHAMWSPCAGNTTLPITTYGMSVWDSTVGRWDATAAPPNGRPPVSAMVAFDGIYIYTNGTAIYTSVDGFTWTARWNPGGPQIVGLIIHDAKVYALVTTFSTVSGASVTRLTVYFCINSTQVLAGTVWPNVSTASYGMAPNEAVTNVVEWTNKLGDKTIFFATTYAIVAWDDSDYFEVFWKIPWAGAAGMVPNICVHPRDDQLYASFGGRTNSVMVFNHEVINDQGPNIKNAITQQTQRFQIGALAANTRHLFGFAPGLVDAIYGSYGRVIRANDQFGWSTLRKGTNQSTRVVTGGFYYDGRVVISYSDGSVAYVISQDDNFSIYNWRDDLNSPYTAVNTLQYLASGEFDANQELLLKLAKYWAIHFEVLLKAGGNPSFVDAANPPYAHRGPQIVFEATYYRTDGVYVTITNPYEINSFVTTPAILPLPSPTDQSGQVFRRLTWRIGMDKQADTSYMTVVRSVALAYTREPYIYDGLQIPIDLSEDRFNGFPDMKFYDLDRGQIRDFIETLKGGPSVPRRHWPVTIGFGGQEYTYASMDVRISGSEDPQSRYGRFVLTLRDLTAPPSGS